MQKLSPSASGGCEGVMKVIETPICLGALLGSTVTSRPFLPAELGHTLAQNAQLISSVCTLQRNMCLHSSALDL